jgi:hypothetical protein
MLIRADPLAMRLVENMVDVVYVEWKAVSQDIRDGTFA